MNLAKMASSALILSSLGLFSEPSYASPPPIGVETSANSTKDKLYQSSQHYERAQLYIEDNDVLAAVIELRNAIKYDSQNLSAYILLADTYLKINEPMAAESILQDALKHGASWQLVALNLSQAYLDQAKYQTLLDSISTANLPFEIKQKVKVMRSKAFLSLKKYAEAESVLREVLPRSLDEVSAQLQMARLYLTQSNIARAKQWLDKVNAKNTDEPQLWLLKGEVARRTYNINQATEFYSRALELDPLQLESLHARASIWLDQSQLDKALLDIKAVRQHYPDDLRGLVLEATWAAKSNNKTTLDRALTDANAVIDKYNHLKLQDEPYYLVLVATIRYMRGEFTSAEGLLKRYLELEPNSLGGLRLMAENSLLMRQPTQALQVATQGLQHYPNNVELIALQAEAHLMLGDFSKAVELFERALALEPNSALQERRAIANFADGKIDNAIEDLQAIAAKGGNGAIARLGDVLIRSGRYEQALQLADEQLKLNPTNPVFYHIKGTAYLGMNEPQQANKVFTDALVVSPNYLPALLNLSKLALKNEELEQARGFLEQALKLDRSNRAVMQHLAIIEEKTGNIHQAIEWLQKVVSNGLDIRTGLWLVKLLGQEKRDKEAEELIRRLISKNPENLGLLAVQAQHSLDNANVAKAKLVYDRLAILAKEKQSIPWLIKVAKYFLASDELERAQSVLESARVIDPQNIVVRATLCEFQLYTGEFDAALASAKRIVTEDPQSPVGYQLAGNALVQLGQLEKAIDWYQKGLENTVGNTALAVSLYKIVSQHRDVASAVAMLEQWVTSSRQNDLRALKVLAAGHTQLGHYEKAISLNLQLEQIVKDDPLVLNNLAVLFSLTNDGRARSYAERAHALAPNSYGVIDTLGWILVNEGELTLGLSMLRNAVAMSGDNAEIRYHYGVALYKSGKKEAAKRELTKALQGSPQFNGVEEARKILNSLSLAH